MAERVVGSSSKVISMLDFVSRKLVTEDMLMKGTVEYKLIADMLRDGLLDCNATKVTLLGARFPALRVTEKGNALRQLQS